MSFKISVTISSESERDFEDMLEAVTNKAAEIRHRTPNAATNIKSVFTPMFVRASSLQGYQKPGRLSNYYGPQTRPQEDKFNQLIFVSHEEATDCLEAIVDIHKRHGYVTRADVYQLVGVQTTFVDSRYGWTSIDDINIDDDHGVRIKFPASVVIP